MVSLQNTLKAFENLGRVLDEKTEENLVNFILQLYIKTKICDNTCNFKMAYVFDTSERIKRITTDP